MIHTKARGKIITFFPERGDVPMPMVMSTKASGCTGSPMGRVKRHLLTAQYTRVYFGMVNIPKEKTAIVLYTRREN